MRHRDNHDASETGEAEEVIDAAEIDLGIYGPHVARRRPAGWPGRRPGGRWLPLLSALIVVVLLAAPSTMYACGRPGGRAAHTR